MSKFDKVRVKFVLTESVLRDVRIRSLVSRIFGKETYENSGDCNIKCPASMFAIFIIERSKLNVTNHIQALAAELIIPEDIASELSIPVKMDFDIE